MGHESRRHEICRSKVVSMTWTFLSSLSIHYLEDVPREMSTVFATSTSCTLFVDGIALGDHPELSSFSQAYTEYVVGIWGQGPLYAF